VRPLPAVRSLEPWQAAAGGGWLEAWNTIPRALVPTPIIVLQAATFLASADDRGVALDGVRAAHRVRRI